MAHAQVIHLWPCTSKQTHSFIPSHLCQEFRKEVQNQLPLKSKVMSVGKQLMANRNYDTRGLDARLEASRRSGTSSSTPSTRRSRVCTRRRWS